MATRTVVGTGDPIPATRLASWDGTPKTSTRPRDKRRRFADDEPTPEPRKSSGASSMKES